MKSHITGKVARYLIDNELYCGMCAENIGGSFIEKKCFQPPTHKCPGDMCDQRSILERMKPHPKGCLEWTGIINFKGYGTKQVKQPDGKWRPRKVHRLEWEKHNGPIPPGMCVLHRCDNPACYNIDHLFLGTKGENNRDRHAKGRSGNAGSPPGEKHGNAKLKEAQVERIKTLLPSCSDAYLAGVYGVSAACIHSIRIGRTWKHVQ